MKESLGENIGTPIDAKGVNSDPQERAKFIEDAVAAGEDPAEAGAEYDVKIAEADARVRADMTDAAVDSLERHARIEERRIEERRSEKRKGSIDRRTIDRRQTEGGIEDREDKN